MENVEVTELKSKIHGDWQGKSVLDYLCGRFRYQDRQAWQASLDQGRVSLNSAPAKAATLLKSGDWVAYRTVLREPPVPTDIPLLYQDEFLAVADKPAHLPSHADGNFIKNTFVYLMGQKIGKVSLAHRLDRETSGLMVVARQPEALKNLMDQFARKAVKKSYLALARGTMEAQEGLIQGWIGRDPGSRISIKRAVVADGTEGALASSTAYQVLRQFETAALLQVVPATGRTSQIRVHLDSIGHPLVGDKLYGRSDAEFLEFVTRVKAGTDARSLGRHMLHASRLEFDHPKTGARMCFESPMPADFQAICA